MTEAQFREKAIESTKRMIDCIAGHEYEKLYTIANISPSWCGGDKTPKEGMAEFTEWLDEQLEMWAEDTGKEFTVDPFEETHFDLFHFENDRASATYHPQSCGERLDFWFELEFAADDNGGISMGFEINI